VTTETPHQKNERTLANWTRRVGQLTLALVLVNIVTAGIFWRQLSVMQNQLDEEKAKGVLEKTQLRGNMRREVPQLSQVGAGTDLGGPKGKSTDWAISPKWINVGGSDVLDYKGWFDVQVFDIVPNKKVDSKDCPSLATPDPLPDGIIIHPGGALEQLSKSLSAQDMIAAENQTKYILMYGHIQYRDVFPDSKPHHADWCVVVFPNNIDKNLFSLPTLKDTAD
jgi:hypothetical protein